MEKTQPRERHDFSDFLYWTMMLFVPVVIGLLAIYRHSVGWFVGYIAALVAMTVVLLRFFCTHCPHYLRQEKKLNCMFFWWTPKYFAPRPGPYDLGEKAATYAAIAVMVGFPLYWLLHEPGLLIAYILSYTVFGLSVRRNECWRCIHKECPFNSAPDNI